MAAQYNLPTDTGLLITDVQAGSPADKAGITANSVMTRFDGTQLTDSSSLLELVMKHKVGDSVKVTIIPANSQIAQEVTITLAARPSGK